MTLKIQIGLLTLGALLIGWHFKQHRGLSRAFATVQEQIQAANQQFDSRGAALTPLEQQNKDLTDAEERAGNQTLLSLMRQSVAVSSTSEESPDTHTVGSALARVLESPDQQELDRESKRNEIRANMGLFFRLAKLPQDRINQYIDVQLEKQSREAKRMSALLRGSMSLDDALRERDSDKQELESQERAALGPDASKFLDSIADSMRTDEAKRQVGAVQEAMGGNPLDQEQTARLQNLIKAELVGLPFDNVDLFRSPDDWARVVGEHYQNVLRAAADFVSPSQMEILKAVADADLADKQKQMRVKRKSLGIK